MTLVKFGEIDGQPIWCATLNYADVMLQILNFGAITKKITYKNHRICLGYDTLDTYINDTQSMGIIAGRVANRTAFGKFSIGDQTYALETNNGQHHLHGGSNGFGKRVWGVEPNETSNSIILSLISQDGDAGYPGQIEIEVRITLDARGITYQMRGVPDRPTPINLAQHTYYNVGGAQRDHLLQLNADTFCPVDETLIPTGQIEVVSGHRDFRDLKKIEQVDPMQIGLDHNFVLNDNVKPSAILSGSLAAIEIHTDQPGLQVYSGQGLGRAFQPYDGMCFEPQFFPDNLNQPNFKSCVHSPDNCYTQTTTVSISDPIKAET